MARAEAMGAVIRAADSVLRVDAVDRTRIATLLRRYALHLSVVAADDAIPGSYWGEPEAGLIGATVYARPRTPVHSLLHESCHFICMPAGRRSNLNTDAGGDHDEENAVCYLQILLAGELLDVGRTRMCRDMDAWGYTFRLGSAAAWFAHDAVDARRWLVQRRLIDDDEITHARL